MKKLVLLMFSLTILSGCFSGSLQSSTRYQTEEQFIEAYDRLKKDNGFMLYKFNTYDSINYGTIRTNDQQKLVGFNYGIYHGPYQGSYNFSSEYDLQMDGMSLFAANDFLVNEIFLDDLIIRSHEINEGISKINYYISFSYVYDGTTYFGHIFLQKTNLAYDDLSLDALINSVVEAYEKL